ncbi:uncharacterized protein LOC135195332 [Macrobrachium nipponense]|uniref:uncharacterized protein LOC135195332 n=1 Tax=Macrobrachium nipponense TaxID=159736 RepID=UPI0030C8021B
MFLFTGTDANAKRKIDFLVKSLNDELLGGSNLSDIRNLNTTSRFQLGGLAVLGFEVSNDLIKSYCIMYSHKSGAQKRKEKQAREEAVSKCARTLFEVGVKKIDTIDTNVEEQNILPSSSESDPSTSQSLVQDAQQEAESDVINAEPKDTEQQRDIGLIPDRPSRVQIEDFVRQGPQPIPSQIASDDKGNSFPYTVLKVQRPNGETGKRDWLVMYTTAKNTFKFGFMWHSSWKKLYNRIPKHEHTNYHKQCYLDWRQLEARLKEESGIDDQLQRSIQSEKSKWKLILKRIFDVVLTLGERGLSFQGESSMIGDTNNGNFLGIIELLSRFDPILQDHVSKVREAQKDGKRLQAHYLSYSSQNEFIQLCAEKVKDCILNERDQAKYYSIMVDATPGMSHTEQSTFILRYLTCDECGKYLIQEISFIY